VNAEHNIGWISPKGAFHPIAGFMKGEIHADYALKNQKLFPPEVFKGLPTKSMGIDDQEELTHRIVKSGWIRKSSPDSYDVASRDHLQKIRGHFRRFHSDAPVPMAVMRVVGKHSEDPGESHVVDVQTGRIHSFEAIEGTKFLFAQVNEMLHVIKCVDCTHTWTEADIADATMRCVVCDSGADVLEAKKLTIRARDLLPRNLAVVTIANRGGKGPMKTKKEKLRDDRKSAKLDLKRGAYEETSTFVDAFVAEDASLDEFLGQAIDILTGGRANPPRWTPPQPTPVTTGGYLGQPGAAPPVFRPSMPPLSGGPSSSSFSGAHRSAREAGKATFDYGGVSYPARHPDERPITSPISSRNRFGGTQFGTVSRPMSSMGIAPSRSRPTPASGVRPSGARTGSRAPSVSSFASMYKASQRYGIPTALFLGVGRQESGFNPNARGAAGERGLVQLMPGAVADYNKAHGTNYSYRDAGQEDLNAEIGAWYLKSRPGKTWRDKLAAYNAGVGGRNRGLGYDYADSVIGHASNYAAREKAYMSAKGQESRKPNP